jgi:integrase
MQSQPNPFKRHTTRHRGITYRVRADGSKLYHVHDRGKFLAAGTTEREALDLQASIRSKRAREERVVVASKVELKTVSEEWFEDAKRRLRASTVKNDRSYIDRIILPKLGERGIGSIGPQDVVELAQELEKSGKAEATISNVLEPLAGTLAHAVFKGLIAANPMNQVPRGLRPSSATTREHREWTSEEVDRVISEARKLDARSESRCSYAFLTEFLLRTGVRLGEALGAQFGDVDFDASLFHVRRQLTKDGRLAEPMTKKAIRRVPLAPGLLQRLATRSLELHATETTFLFAQSKEGLPPTQSNYRHRGWDRAVEKAGLSGGPRVTPHDARHAFVSQLASLGIASSDLAEILGHTTAGVTESIYTHSFDRQARETRVREAMVTAMGNAAGD